MVLGRPQTAGCAARALAMRGKPRGWLGGAVREPRGLPRSRRRRERVPLAGRTGGAGAQGGQRHAALLRGGATRPAEFPILGISSSHSHAPSGVIWYIALRRIRRTFINGE
jgi:hypothetical protein